LFEISGLDCTDAEQKANVRARQIGCCGGVEYTELLCPERPLSSLNDIDNDVNNTALIGGIAGSVGCVLLVALLGIVYMKKFRSNKEYDTSLKQKSPTAKISYNNDDEKSVVSNL